MDYAFFVQMLQQLIWKPSRVMECADMGYGFYEVSFHKQVNRERAKGWTMLPKLLFLTIRKWEPYFNTEKASWLAIAL